MDRASALESLPEVSDALVIDTSELGRRGELVLLIVPVPTGAPVDAEIEQRVRRALRSQLSPRHVPDRIVTVAALPRTLNGKKLEVPIRRILLGTPPDEAVAPGALADPSILSDVLSALAQAGLR